MTVWPQQARMTIAHFVDCSTLAVHLKTPSNPLPATPPCRAEPPYRWLSRRVSLRRGTAPYEVPPSMDLQTKGHRASQVAAPDAPLAWCPLLLCHRNTAIDTALLRVLVRWSLQARHAGVLSLGTLPPQ